ncbi:hypothetical protein [Hymenobacter swuensis]|uniref:hypothetical protein n=1 Tax=Hymenobacter swuensis TaxID=1446467 RepID=UPI0012DCE400|nr:hypothetical protein [Hymenobacter swuensis]
MFRNARTYRQSWLRRWPVLLIVGVGVGGYIQLGQPVAGGLMLVTLLLYAWRMARECFVTQVKLTADDITVHYYKRFHRQKATLPIADTHVTDPREPTYMLELFGIHHLYLTCGTARFLLSTTDGFTPAQLHQLYDELVGDEHST